MTATTLETPARTWETSARTYARAAGVLFLVLAVLGPFSILYVPSQLVEDGDAAATAANVAADESLFRAAIASDAVIMLTEIAMTAVLFVLFRPVSLVLSVMSALGRLAQTAVMGANLVLHFGVLLVLGGAGFLAAFERDQLDALALLALDLHGYGVYVGQAFFGFSLLVLAVLIHRSGYVPRVFGAPMAVAGAGYLADSFGNFLAPEHEETLGVLVGVTSVLGEVPFFLWLLVKGVDVTRTRTRAAGAAAA
jgi:hypothetical protein